MNVKPTLRRDYVGVRKSWVCISPEHDPLFMVAHGNTPELAYEFWIRGRQDIKPNAELMRALQLQQKIKCEIISHVLFVLIFGSVIIWSIWLYKFN